MFEERHLNFNKFLEERAEQISKFRDILKLQTKKKGHQALPKCIRRRAMSHNRYRIPSKMRKLNEQQLIKSQNMQRIPKSRKHIRKRNRLILSYKQRHSKIKWLSTHLWAARRMRMIDFHGYKVAYTPNQKSFRSSYRHFRHNCCMIDLSYYQCLSIKLHEHNSQIPKNIRLKTNQGLRNNLLVKQLKQTTIYEGLLYGDNENIICPLIVFNCGIEQQQKPQYLLRCFFHPCSLEQVKLTFQPYSNIQISKCKSQLYCLLGPQWNNKLFQALNIYGLSPDLEKINNIKFKANQNLFYASSNEKKQQKVPYISNPLPSLMKSVYCAQKIVQNVRQQTLKLLSHLNSLKNKIEIQNPLQQNVNAFWNNYKQIPNYSDKVAFKITNRSKYTHKRKNKLSKQTKKKIISLENKKKQLISSKIALSEQDSNSHEMIEESLQSIKNQIKQFFIDEKQNKGQQNIAQQNNAKKNVYRTNPVLISSFKKTQLYEGCFIFCSDDDNCRFWRILSKLNIKVIGLQQFEHVNLESQNLLFPLNYKNTNSFLKHSQFQGAKQFKRIQRRPPQKRINFLNINSANPFSLVEQSIVQNSLNIFIQMVNKGRCFTGSYIYQLNSQDISLISDDLNSKGKIGIVLSQTQKHEYTGGSKKKQKYFLDYKNQKYEDILLKLQQKESKRKLIGRITSGGYLYSKSKQGGIGYVSQKNGKSINQLSNDGYVLVRKVTSPHYYLGQITKIYSD